MKVKLLKYTLVKSYGQGFKKSVKFGKQELFEMMHWFIRDF